MNRSAYVYLILTMIFWGGNAVAGKMAVGHISPMLLNSARWGLAMVILLAIGWPRLVADWSTIRQRAAYFLVLGTVGFTLFNVLLYSALIYTSAVNASIEQAGVPMFIFIANFLFFGMRASYAQIIGFVISIFGVVLTASHGEPARLLALDVNFGDLLLLGAIIAYSSYTVALRLKPSVHWQSLMIALTTAGFISSIPFTAGEAWADAMILPDMRGWLIILYATLFPSILSQMFYVRGVELIGPNRAGLFVNLVPVFGTLMSVVLIGEEFHLYHAVALGLVLGGIWLAETGGRGLAPRRT